jgi:PAS domain S-box-containing protein
MKRNSEKEENNLRNRAEKLAADSSREQTEKSTDEQSFHELQVHQIELELQNEELIQTQLELEKARTRMMHLFHNAPVGYVVLDSSGLIKQSNTTFANMIGLDFTELTGKPFVQYLEEEDQPIFRGRYKTFFQNPENKRIELRLMTEGNDLFFVRLEAVPNSQRGNTPGAEGFDELFMTVSNITQEKLNEQKVEFLNLILKSITGVNQLIIRQKNQSLLINEICETLVETQGFYSTWILLLNEDQSFKEWAQAGRGNDFHQFEENLVAGEFPHCIKRALTDSGAVVTTDPVENCPTCPLSKKHQKRGALTIRLEQGERIYGILCLSTDTDMIVSEGLILVEELARDIAFALHDMDKEKDKLRAQRALKESEEKLAVTLRSIGDGVITTDTEGKVVLINKVAEELTGWSQSEATGKSLNEVFPIINELTRQPCENPGEKVLETGEIIALSNHTMLISRSGKERIIADSGAPIKNSQGQIIGVVLVFRDITEKQRLQEHLQKSEKLDSLGLLAGGIAHDFNNLLSGIFGYIDLARMECSDHDDMASYLDRALNVYDRAKDLTQQLLTFSKGGAPVRKSGKISTLVKSSTEFVLSGSNIASEFDIPSSLRTCEYDENQMSQVIDNLVLNAQQAMPMGGTVKIKLRNVDLKENEIGLLPGGNYICITLSDQGVGIPQEILGNIFDPFFSTKQKGSGLGLATCYSIIQKHDGHLTVESSPGKGAQFSIYLPASDKAVYEGEETTPIVIKDSGTILIMDDEVFIREITSSQLRDAGYTVIEAAAGEEALEFINRFRNEGKTIKAIILDLTIPGGMGGREVVKKIRETDKEIVIFASSGYSDDPVIANPKAYGFNDSIRKPFRQQDLYDMFYKNLKMDKN